MSTPPVRNFLSSGADPVLRRWCDAVARLGGRIIAGLLDDMIHDIETGAAPRDAIERVLHRYGTADPVMLQATGATRWPPAVQPVPADLHRPGPPPGAVRAFRPVQRAA